MNDNYETEQNNKKGPRKIARINDRQKKITAHREEKETRIEERKNINDVMLMRTTGYWAMTARILASARR